MACQGECKEESTGLDDEEMNGVITTIMADEYEKNEYEYTCLFCSKVFSNEELLIDHQIAHQPSTSTLNSNKDIQPNRTDAPEIGSISNEVLKPYKCQHCPRSYKKKCGLRRHMNIHDVKKQVKCEICWRIFPTKYNYEIHMNTHNGNKPYKCPTCERCFSHPSVLKYHQYTHVSEKTFKCPKCPQDKFFRSMHHLRNHIIFHEEKRHKCVYCDKKFHTSSSLKSHLRTHTRTKLTCQFCLKSFSQSRRYWAHVATHSTDEGVHPFKCQSCDKCFKSKSYANAHSKKCRGSEHLEDLVYRRTIIAQDDAIQASPTEDIVPVFFSVYPNP